MILVLSLILDAPGVEKFHARAFFSSAPSSALFDGALPCLKGLQGLEWLNIGYTYLSQEGRVELKKALPTADLSGFSDP